MQFYIIIVLLQLIIICDKENLLYVTALIGENVSKTDNNEFPALVALLMYYGPNSQKESNLICTGSLISRAHLVTAEHCLYMLQDEYILFVVGSNDVRDGLQRFSMWWLSYDQWISHFNYQTTLIKNDIAVVKLTRRVPSHIIPVNLSNRTVPELVGWQIVVTGWGKHDKAKPSRYLKKATLSVYTNNHCAQIGSLLQGQTITIADNWFCSMARPYALFDLGDSGGPAFDSEGRLLGINLGHCPKYNDTFHPDKSNLHLAIAYYIPYITFCLQE